MTLALAGGCTLCPAGVHLHIFSCKLGLKKIFSPPWGCRCTHCTPWLRLWGIGSGNYDSDSLPRIIVMLLRSLDREKLRTLHLSHFKLLTTLTEDNYYLVICDASFWVSCYVGSLTSTNMCIHVWSQHPESAWTLTSWKTGNLVQSLAKKWQTWPNWVWAVCSSDC